MLEMAFCGDRACWDRNLDLNTCFMTKSRESFLQAVHIFISFYLYFALSEHGPKP